jgi:uncharacterized membrane protein YbhN (UPF0104 family)
VTSPLPSYAIALVLVAVEALLRAWRLQWLTSRERRPAFWRAFTANAYGDALSVVTPGRLGGDPARFVTLTRSGTDRTTALVALGAEQAIDWLVLGTAGVALAAGFGEEGLHGLAGIAQRVARVDFVPWLVLVAVLLVVGGAAAHAYRRRHPGVLHQSLRRAIASARALPARSLGLATALTTLCSALRVAVLPVLLLPYHSGGSLGAVILGSFGLVYGQMFLPTPAGVGGVELGFVAGFAGDLSAPAVAGLLVAWRVFTTGFDMALGGALFVGSWWAGARWPASPSPPDARFRR